MYLIPHSTEEDKLEFTGEKGILFIHLLKSGLNTRKYFLIVSNLLYIFEVTESIGFNVQKIVLELDFAR